jgi:hypothetical protein
MLIFPTGEGPAVPREIDDDRATARTAGDAFGGDGTVDTCLDDETRGLAHSLPDIAEFSTCRA